MAQYYSGDEPNACYPDPPKPSSSQDCEDQAREYERQCVPSNDCAFGDKRKVQRMCEDDEYFRQHPERLPKDTYGQPREPFTPWPAQPQPEPGVLDRLWGWLTG